MCPTCGRRLRRSFQQTTPSGVLLKSCPNCSRNTGRHVFYTEESFGLRNMGDGTIRVQSWCPPCRSDQLPTPQAASC